MKKKKCVARSLLFEFSETCGERATDNFFQMFLVKCVVNYQPVQCNSIFHVSSLNLGYEKFYACVLSYVETFAVKVV